jgi:putative transposase
LKEIVTVLLAEADCPLVAVDTEVDHIHVVFKAKPKHQLSKLINALKGVTARRLFQEFPALKNRLWKGHLWSPSYFLVTVGGAPVDIIKRYVETQRER